MSRMSEIHIEIAEQIQGGSFPDDVVEFIINKYGFPYDVAERMVYEVEADVSSPDDSMDGDHASALASAGFGTDEDYGHFDDYNYDYE